MDTSTTVAINKKRDFTMVKTSTIHGKGVFAQKIIPKGTRIIEYAGKRVLKANLVKDLVKGINSLRYVMNLDEKIPVDEIGRAHV